MIKVSDLKMAVIYVVVWGVRNGLENAISFMREITYSGSLATSAQVEHFGQFIISSRNGAWLCVWQLCDLPHLVIVERSIRPRQWAQGLGFPGKSPGDHTVRFILIDLDRLSGPKAPFSKGIILFAISISAWVPSAIWVVYISFRFVISCVFRNFFVFSYYYYTYEIIEYIIQWCLGQNT